MLAGCRVLTLNGTGNYLSTAMKYERNGLIVDATLVAHAAGKLIDRVLVYGQRWLAQQRMDIWTVAGRNRLTWSQEVYPSRA